MPDSPACRQLAAWLEHAPAPSLFAGALRLIKVVLTAGPARAAGTTLGDITAFSADKATYTISAGAAKVRVVFLKDDDRLVIQGVSTGDTPIESGAFNARFMIILPNGETVIRDRPIVTPSGSPAAPGELIFAEFEGAAARSLNVENPLLVESFSFQAFMPEELGGDTTQSFNVPLS